MDGIATGARSKCAYNKPARKECGQPLEYCDCDDYQLEDVALSAYRPTPPCINVRFQAGQLSSDVHRARRKRPKFSSRGDRQIDETCVPCERHAGAP
jgi:hypothetical protein